MVSPAVFGGDAKSSVAAVNGGDWEFSVSAGAAYRQAGTLEFHGGSRSGGFPVQSFVGQDSLTVPSIGAAGKIGDRTYDDGYVGRDFSTDRDGLTTRWGYQNAGQVAGDEISFHASGFESIRTDLQEFGPSSSGEDHERTLAPVLEFAGKSKRAWNGFRPGFSAGLSWEPVRVNRGWSDYTLTQLREDFRNDFTDTYNLGGVGALIPDAPYSGTAAGPGFILENVPDSRQLDEVLVGSETARIANRVSTRFRASHTTVSFGPTVEREIAKSWSLQAGAGVSLHWLHWSAEQDEKLLLSQKSGSSELARWHDSSSGDRLLSGVYLQLGTEWRPESSEWSLKTYLRGDLGSSFSQKVGPSRFTYDSDGFTAAVMVGHPL